jgi:hypothetical protein
MAGPADTPTPRTTPAAPDPPRIDKPAEEPVERPEVVVQRISPPLPAAPPTLASTTALSAPVAAPAPSPASTASAAPPIPLSAPAAPGERGVALPLPLVAAPPAYPAPPAPVAAATGPDLAAAVARSRTALAQGIEALGDEIASFARHSLDTTADTAKRMLEVKTWADAVAVNTGFARASLDHWLDSSAKVSALGVKLAIESSKPFVAGFGKVWSGRVR